MVTDDTQCFWCGISGWARGLEEHHLWRASQRTISPSVYLCHECHNKATFNKDFEIKLQNIYKFQYENDTIKSNTIASYGSGKYNPRNYTKDKQNTG